MIREEIVIYEVAKLAKEKGFPQEVSRWRDSTSPSRNYYNHKGELNGDCLEIIKCICRKEEVPIELQTIAAPTQSLLQRWLREEKGFIVCVVLDTRLLVEECKVRYGWVISNKTAFKCGEYDTKQIITDKRFDVYEEALEDALKYSLKNLV